MTTPDATPAEEPSAAQPAEPVEAVSEEPAASALSESEVSAGKQDASERALTPEERAARRDRALRIFWTVGSILSIGLNLILCLLLLALTRETFTLKKIVGADMLGGLYSNFIAMDQAHIRTTIPIQTEIPVSFELPISQDTLVVTTQPSFISGANLVSLTTGGLSIRNAPADIVLPAGTALNVHLEMTVPVDTTIPVALDVPVDIALDQTEMHAPLVGLQQVVSPFYWMLKPEWISCRDVPILSRLGPLCTLFFREP